MDPKMTLRQNFERSQKGRPAPPKQPIDPLTKWLGCEVLAFFISGRTLEGKLSAVWRFDIEIVEADGIANHVCKHSVERIRRK